MFVFILNLILKLAVAGIVPVGVMRDQRLAVPTPVANKNDNGLYVVPSVLTSIVKLEPLDAVVVFSIPKLNDREV